MHVLNQSRGHWLLNDALIFFISINLKFKAEIETLTSFDNILEKMQMLLSNLTCMASNIKKKVSRVLNFILFPKIKGRKIHN
jgi:hypothetical protein